LKKSDKQFVYEKPEKFLDMTFLINVPCDDNAINSFAICDSREKSTKETEQVQEKPIDGTQY